MSDQPNPQTGQTQATGGQNLTGEALALSKGFTFLPQAKNFEIPDFVYETYPEMINLTLETESMNDEERQYWFQILPIMTEEQVAKYKEILVTEKEQLAALDSQYSEELVKINDQKAIEAKAIETQKRREEMRVAEEKAQQEEADREAALLKELENL
jgi:hypothetical protein